MTPIERAARALADVIAPIIKRSSGGYAGLTQEDLFDAARAVLTAIREPSEGMERAGWTADLPFTPSIKVGVVWQAMIDAMLAEEG